MNKSTQDAGIPVLTEIIELPQNEPEVLEAAPEPAATFADGEDASQESSTPPIDGWLDEEWTRLEQKISVRTLAQLQERIDPVLEQHIRDSLAASVENAVAEIRGNLQLTLEQLVRDAVAQEIENMQFSKR